MLLFTLILPYLPIAALFELVPLPGPILMAIVGITVLYITASECTKKIFASSAESVGSSLKNSPRACAPPEGRGWRLPPRHPCRFPVKHGGATLSRLCAQRTPAGLGLDRVGAPC